MSDLIDDRPYFIDSGDIHLIGSFAYKKNIRKKCERCTHKKKKEKQHVD